MLTKVKNFEGTVPESFATVANSITVEERAKRERAFRFARASVGLEGFKPSAMVEAQARRFINGEIQLQEFLQAPGAVSRPLVG